jgi:hypothetical protein
MAEVTPVPLLPKPGVTKNDALRYVEGRWIDSDFIRIRDGLPEKRGGWTAQTTVAVSGQARATHAWRDNNSQGNMAAGTYRKLYVFDSDWVINDITPYRLTGTETNNPFTTTNASNLVSVSHNAHGLTEGATILWSGATTFNNVTMNGTFIVLTVTNANAYVVTAATTANASGSGGGAAVLYSYEINVGVEQGAFGLGWGVGGWGLGTWGTAHSSSTIFIEPRIWSLDHFGQILLATYNGGSLYQFDPTQAKPWPRALVVAAAPTDFRAMFITPERFVIALRAAMVLHGSSQSDFNTWTPASSNTAFTRTLQEGTKLVSGRVLGPFLSLVWSDGALFLLQYTGSQFVYNVSLAGKDCGLIAPGAAVTVNGIAYWMGQETFWKYDGSVQKMANVDDIRNFVFDNLKVETAYQCHAVYCAKHDEIEFFYGITGDSNPSKSVIYSIKDQVWVPNNWNQSLGRVSGTHFTQGDTRPIMAGTDGIMYLHENGNNANGSAISWFIEMAPVALHEGYSNMRLLTYQMDVEGQVGDVTIVFKTYDRLQEKINNSTPEETTTETYTTTTGILEPNISGRYCGIKYSGSALGGFARLGKPVGFVKPKGKRR